MMMMTKMLMMMKESLNDMKLNSNSVHHKQLSNQ